MPIIRQPAANKPTPVIRSAVAYRRPSAGGQPATVVDQHSKWVKRKPGPAAEAAEMRLFCLSWAGGNSTSFRTWPSHIDSRIEVIPIELPGRLKRAKEPMLANVGAIVDQLADALKALDLLRSKPFSIFGHSFGAMIAFELTRLLSTKHSVSPVHLFLSGKRACNLPFTGKVISKLARDELVEHLVELGGIPPELVEQAALLDYFLPTVRGDYGVYEQYEYSEEKGGVPITCPVTAYGGSDDESTSVEDLEHWGTLVAEGQFNSKIFKGGHFYLKEDEQELVTGISEILTAVLDL